MMYTLTNVTCGLWDSSLADGFNFSISYKFVMLLSLPLAIVHHNNNNKTNIAANNKYEANVGKNNSNNFDISTLR